MTREQTSRSVEAAVASDLSRERTVLIVDDDELVAERYATILESCRFTVYRATSPSEAKRLFEKDREIDVALIDIWFEEGPLGYRIAEEISDCRDIPILMISGYTNRAHIDALRESVHFVAHYGVLDKSSSDAAIMVNVEAAIAKHARYRHSVEIDRTYQLLFETADESLLICEVEDDGMPGRILKANVGAERDLGLSAEQIGEMGFRDLLSGDFGQQMRAALRELGEQQRFSCDLSVRRGPEETFPARVRAKLVELSDRSVFTLSLQSLQERERYESQLRQRDELIANRESLIREVTENMPGLVFELERHREYGNRIPFAGSRVRSILELEPQEIRDSAAPVFERIHPDDRAHVIESLDESERISRPCELEFRVNLPLGGLRWLRLYATPLPERGQATLFHGYLHDVSDRKATETRVEALLKEKELLLREVHHRIKNHLATISSFLSLQALSSDESAVRVALNEACTRVQVMGELYDRLYRSGEFEVVHVPRYFDYLLRSLESTMADTHGVVLDLESDDFSLAPAMLFPLGMIVTELVTNAYKYAFSRTTPENRISVSIREQRVPNTPDRAELELRVSDNGFGLPDDVQVGSSSGFGMMLLEGICAQIGATVEIQREGGSMFIVRVPTDAG